MRSVRLWNNGWQFQKTGLGVEKEALIENNFQNINVPHDWMIYQTTDLYENSIGWYRKKFQYQKSENLTALRFEGVYMDSTIWINGEYAFEWKYGYSAFEFDITKYVVDGENEILVRVVYQKDNSRWYSGAGIYRDVFLKETSQLHLATDGVYVHSKKAGKDYQVTIHTEVMQGPGSNLGSLRLEKREYEKRAFQIRQTLSYNGIEKKVVETGTSGTQFTELRQDFILEDVNEWDVEHPFLYELETSLLDEEGKVLDTLVQKIGFRDMKYDPDHGFILNGRKVRINGVCEHHDLGCLGAAVNPYAIRRKLLKLREMGVNAIRTSHNMPAKEWLEMADEMGFLIDCEAFDMWELSKTEFDYARFFKEWSEIDVASWIRRDRNHPCVMFWSIGNEIYDTHKDEHGQEITKYLTAYVETHDPYKNAPVTIGSNYMPWENAQKCADLIKMAGYNYAEKYYEEHHKLHPDWVIYGSETSSTVQSRGVYKFPLEKAILCDDDEQCSCLGNCSTAWGSKRPEYNIAADREKEFSCGQFIWTGFDYIGEPTPYATKNSYFGQLDTAGFQKDTFYIYQAEWTDAKVSPMVHIFPYWDFNDGEVIDVRVCSNGAMIELYLNDILIGSHKIDHLKGSDQVAHFKIPYEKGVLKAIAYDEEGKEIATDFVKSFGDASQIVLRPEKTKLCADGKDLLFLEISVLDEDGTEVSNANNRMQISVTGAGWLTGLDNGDSTDYEPYKGTSRRLFNGKLLAVIQAGDQPGDIQIVVDSMGMESKTLTIPVVASSQEAVHQFKEPLILVEKEEIPIRSVKLIVDGPRNLDKENQTTHIRAVIQPSNATYRDIVFKATNDSGVPSNILSFEGGDLEKDVTALGDGVAYMKCMVYNGSDKVSLISQVKITVSGMGAADLNPYEFISASLYTSSSHELGTGLDRGVAMPANTVSSVSFEKVNFGKNGSDTITIPVYELNNKPFPIEIWDGMKGEPGAYMLDKVIYDLPSIWSKYQEKTYVLPKRLKGIHTITFVAEHNIEIKGFQFKEYERAYDTNEVTTCDHLYGDTYELTEDAIIGIGNNVSISFEQMDFSKGVKQLVICGRTSKDINTIHVRFEDENGITNQIAEFKHSEAYEEQVFELQNVTGKKTVHFVFLPGCSFDFQYFRFEYEKKG